MQDRCQHGIHLGADLLPVSPLPFVQPHPRTGSKALFEHSPCHYRLNVTLDRLRAEAKGLLALVVGLKDWLTLGDPFQRFIGCHPMPRYEVIQPVLTAVQLVR